MNAALIPVTLYGNTSRAVRSCRSMMSMLARRMRKLRRLPFFWVGCFPSSTQPTPFSMPTPVAYLLPACSQQCELQAVRRGNPGTPVACSTHASATDSPHPPLALLRLGDDLGAQQLSLGSIDRSQRLTDAAP